jgi:hypothetical protein
VETRDGTERHPPHILDQSQPEHRRYGPQLADGERRHLLKCAHEVADVVDIDAALAVTDQCDRQLVDAGIAGQRSRGQLG